MKSKSLKTRNHPPESRVQNPDNEGDKRRHSPRARARRRDWRPAYLAALSEIGIGSHAAKAARVSRGEVWRERKANEVFAAEERKALELAVTELHDEAVQRAVHGHVRLLFTPAGEIIIDPQTGKPYEERIYSDRLLMWLLSYHKPEVYGRQRQAKVESAKAMTLDEFKTWCREAKAAAAKGSTLKEVE